MPHGSLLEEQDRLRAWEASPRSRTLFYTASNFSEEPIICFLSMNWKPSSNCSLKWMKWSSETRDSLIEMKDLKREELHSTNFWLSIPKCSDRIIWKQSHQIESSDSLRSKRCKLRRTFWRKGKGRRCPKVGQASTKTIWIWRKGTQSPKKNTKIAS